MILDGQSLATLLGNSYIQLLFKIGFIVIAILYFVFSLIVIGQIRLMTETVKTEAGALLRFFSIIHAGIALGLIVLFIAML